MKRHGLEIFIIIACVIVAFVWLLSSSKTTTITELNESYHGSILKITATDLKALPNPDNADEILVGIKFKYENVSKNDSFLIWGSNIEGYIDDVAVGHWGEHYFNEPEVGLIGTKLSPGKQTAGYYCLRASKDAKNIEVRITEKYNQKYVSFVFKIPELEETYQQ